jgi:hypothetical protein
VLSGNELVRVQERALNLLRNMCAHCSSPDVKLVLEWTNDEIYQLLISRVDPSASHPVSQRVHALYTLVNIAAAGAFVAHQLGDCDYSLPRGTLSVLLAMPLMLPSVTGSQYQC